MMCPPHSDNSEFIAYQSIPPSTHCRYEVGNSAHTSETETRVAAATTAKCADTGSSHPCMTSISAPVMS
jgi:hypothetical protein